VRVLALTHVFPRRADDPSAPFLLTWARALQAGGVDLAVVAPHDAGLPRRPVVGGVPVALARYAPERFERLAYRGEMHHIARTPAGPPLVAALLGALALEVRRQVRAGDPDVLHVHWWVPGAVVARLARVDVPTVVTVHGTDVALLEARPRLARLARWALDGADRVEAVSSALAERLEAVTGRAADAVNPMPLHPDRLAPPAPAGGAEPRGERLEVLAVGRLVPEKGFGDLVQAAARARTPLRLVLVGDGPDRGRLAALASSLGVDLTLTGTLSPGELGKAYANADVLAQPSHAEGLGLVVAEALAAGLPVVSTDCGGVRDLLPSEGLVPVADPGALAAALDDVAADLPAARDRAERRAARVRGLLAPEAAAARTLAGYAQLTPA
jgi:glycosyltransferase involved in cell wall biosynthesis